MPESIDTSLVRIHTKAGGVAGAGFLVGERHILTCAHVIAQALGLELGFSAACFAYAADRESDLLGSCAK